MCTDGMANVGLGALSDMENDVLYEQASAFYDEVGNFARDAGWVYELLWKTFSQSLTNAH